MAKLITNSTLNASTFDILNVIRQNASSEYQDLVPEVTKATDLPKVGDVLMGYPALANQFVSSLVNRIAAVLVKSATFNNPYRDLKKGYLEYGEVVEEVYVNITKARIFDYEKADKRELKRSMPDVRTALHCMNWNVQYPVTVSNRDLQKAFLNETGVQDLIARIVDAVYKAAEYDEYLLFKYLIIQAATAGKMYPVSVGAGTDMKEAAVAFRSISNEITFLKNKYNNEAVYTNTPKEDQVIFMSAAYNAKFDVEVLASAFNMEKADFMGRLYLIDDFTTFDNERFDVIRAESDMIPEITQEQLTLMKDVVAVIVDKEWMQVYDNVSKFTEKYVASGDYWNYFYNVQKTISSSPFANAVCFVTSGASINLPATLTAHITEKSTKGNVTVFTIEVDKTDTIAPHDALFVQTQQATEAGVGVHRYGSILLPTKSKTYTPVATIDNTTYTSGTAIEATTAVGAEFTLTKG